MQFLLLWLNGGCTVKLFLCNAAVVVEQGLTSTKHTIGHIGDGFYGSKDPTNSVKALKEERS